MKVESSLVKIIEVSSVRNWDVNGTKKFGVVETPKVASKFVLYTYKAVFT